MSDIAEHLFTKRLVLEKRPNGKGNDEWNADDKHKISCLVEPRRIIILGVNCIVKVSHSLRNGMTKHTTF